jgi:hypothetical protein
MVFANTSTFYADSLTSDRFMAPYQHCTMTAKTTPYPSCHRSNLQARQLAGTSFSDRMAAPGNAYAIIPPGRYVQLESTPHERTILEEISCTYDNDVKKVL